MVTLWRRTPTYFGSFGLRVMRIRGGTHYGLYFTAHREFINPAGGLADG